jgi:hypothetical protein
MKAMGHTDIKTTMIYVSLWKSHIREQVEKLNAIRLLPPPIPRLKTLPVPARTNCERSFNKLHPIQETGTRGKSHGSQDTASD